MGLTSPSNMMLDCYRRYVGSLRFVETREVILGMGAMMIGMMLAVVGWGLYLWTERLPADAAGLWTLREAAFASVALGVPLLMLGVVGLLMADRQISKSTIRYASAIGFAVCLIAVGAFVASYPTEWNVTGTPDYSLHGATLYGMGLMLLAGATGAAISCRCVIPTEADAVADE